MNFKDTILFLAILSLVLSDQKQGLDTTCQQGGCTNAQCGTTPYGTWTQGKGDNKCAINQCDTSKILFANNSVTDAFCHSCPTDLAQNGAYARQIYANYDRYFCVEAEFSCTNRQGQGWTDHDCNVCGHKDGKYAKADQSGCTKSITTVGKEVPCQKNNSCDSCPQYPSFIWQLVSGSQKNCQLQSYFAAMFPTQNLTDLMCSSNPDLSNTKTFASLDKTSCVSSPAVVGKPVPCQKNGNCDNCPTIVGFSWQLTQNSQTHCQIKSCLANDFPSDGLTDSFCGSCPPDSDKKRIYASEDKKICIQKSQDTNEEIQDQQQHQQKASHGQFLSFAVCSILLINLFF
ncbi:hypothetical protein ABPG74_002739 [Tetrahymena malaccensis]